MADDFSMKAVAVFAPPCHKSRSQDRCLAAPEPPLPSGRSRPPGYGRQITAPAGGRHPRRAQARNLYHLCPLETCARPFANKSDMQRHTLIHSHEKKHSCPVPCCGKRFTRKDELRAHSRLHSIDTAWLCRFDGCARRFAHQTYRQIHERTHTGEKPYICPFEGCDRRFSQKGNRTRHLLVHSREQPHGCPVIGCDVRFVHTASARRHLRRHHGLLPSSIPPESSPLDTEHAPLAYRHQGRWIAVNTAPFPCPVIGCGQHFLTEPDQKAHLRTHTGERFYDCPFAGCGARTGTLLGLKVHQHVHKKPQPPVSPPRPREVPGHHGPRLSPPLPPPAGLLLLPLTGTGIRPATLSGAVVTQPGAQAASTTDSSRRPVAQGAPPLMCLPDNLVDWLEQQPAAMPSDGGEPGLFSPDKMFDGWGPAFIPSPGSPLVPPDWHRNPGTWP